MSGKKHKIQKANVTVNSIANGAASNNMEVVNTTETNANVNVTGGDQETILREIRGLKNELLQRIDEKAESQATEIRSICDQLREEFKTTMDLAGAKTTALEEKVTSVETALSDHSDILVSLQEDVANLKKLSCPWSPGMRILKRDLVVVI